MLNDSNCILGSKGTNPGLDSKNYKTPGRKVRIPPYLLFEDMTVLMEFSPRSNTATLIFE